MQKMNHRLACTTLLLGLCLALLGSACTSRHEEVRVTMEGISLGVIVDEDARVVDIIEDRRSLIATELGMRVGDTVLSINDEPLVLDVEAIIQQGHALTLASEAKVKVFRDGEEIVLTTPIENQEERVQAAEAELNTAFEGKTEAEVDKMFEEQFIPYDPETAPPTATPVPGNLYGL